MRSAPTGPRCAAKHLLLAHACPMRELPDEHDDAFFARILDDAHGAVARCLGTGHVRSKFVANGLRACPRYQQGDGGLRSPLPRWCVPPARRRNTSGVSLERLLKPTHRAPRFGRTNSSNTLSQPGAFSRVCGKIPVSRQTMGLNCVPFGGLTSDAELERPPAGVTSMAPRFS